MTTPAERKALNEGTFRDANEELERGARELVDADDTSLVPFICECPRPDCVQVVLVTLAEYEDVRAGSSSASLPWVTKIHRSNGSSRRTTAS